jgi:hypothetical protein
MSKAEVATILGKQQMAIPWEWVWNKKNPRRRYPSRRFPPG